MKCLWCGGRSGIVMELDSGKICWGCYKCLSEWVVEKENGIVEVWCDNDGLGTVAIHVPEGSMIVVDV